MIQVLNDYKANIPIDMIARKNNMSLHQVVKILHLHTVEIAKCKKILKEIR